jgi:hypothetical protein
MEVSGKIILRQDGFFRLANQVRFQGTGGGSKEGVRLGL